MKGVGFVSFENPLAVRDCFKAQDELRLRNQPVKITQAKTKAIEIRYLTFGKGKEKVEEPRSRSRSRSRSKEKKTYV